MKKIHKLTWVWLVIVGFGVLILYATFELNRYYSVTKAYFDNSGTLSARNLAERSRYHLTETLDIVSNQPYGQHDRQHALNQLDIAYGLLNIEYHKKEYPCTEQALGYIDELHNLLRTQPQVSLSNYNQLLFPAVRCTEAIQLTLDKKRTALANEMVAKLTLMVKVITGGAALILGAGALTWRITHNQSKLIYREKKEAKKWIQHALEDALTGAGNRRALDLAMAKSIDTDSNCAVLMCDLDYFKQYNDLYGHSAGDEALKLVSHAISTVLNGKDRLYRYGGEELVVVLADVKQEETHNIALGILQLVRELNLKHGKSEHQVVTISIGYATYEDQTNLHKLIQLADERLYTAKQSGRNTVYPNTLSESLTSSNVV